MLVGLVVVSPVNETLQTSCRNEPVQEGDTKLSEILVKVFLPTIIAGQSVGSFRRNLRK